MRQGKSLLPYRRPLRIFFSLKELLLYWIRFKGLPFHQRHFEVCRKNLTSLFLWRIFFKHIFPIKTSKGIFLYRILSNFFSSLKYIFKVFFPKILQRVIFFKYTFLYVEYLLGAWFLVYFFSSQIIQRSSEYTRPSHWKVLYIFENRPFQKPSPKDIKVFIAKKRYFSQKIL